MDDGTDTTDTGAAHPEIRPAWSRSDRPIPRRVLRPLQEFLDTATASGTVLLVAAVLALIWANSPWSESYESFWGTTVSIRLGDVGITEDLRHWVNDGLMALFFLTVGLEIKREFLIGELRERRSAALPIVAAIGGMVVPAILYAAINLGGPGAAGWGIPMATDIAFALGVLLLAARHAPPGLKPFVLTLAIVDDVGAILVIALFYSQGVSLIALLGAVGGCLALLALRRMGIRSTAVFVVLGALVWLATAASGIHPTIAGVVLGLLAPADPFQRPHAVSAEARRTADLTVDDPDPVDADARHWLRLASLSREAVSPLARTEHALLPWTNFVIVPVFALANAGVPLTGDALAAAVTSPVTLGIVVGLVAGKVIGISGASALSVHRGFAKLPTGVGLRHVVGAGTVAGVGFTVSLFITELAFDDPRLIAEAKVGILAASVIAGVAGWLVLRSAPAVDGASPDPEA